MKWGDKSIGTKQKGKPRKSTSKRSLVDAFQTQITSELSRRWGCKPAEFVSFSEAPSFEAR
jgi:hypothetical protein